jgi:hypothetical protein
VADRLQPSSLLLEHPSDDEGTSPTELRLTPGQQTPQGSGAFFHAAATQGAEAWKITDVVLLLSDFYFSFGISFLLLQWFFQRRLNKILERKIRRLELLELLFRKPPEQT